MLKIQGDILETLSVLLERMNGEYVSIEGEVSLSEDGTCDRHTVLLSKGESSFVIHVAPSGLEMSDNFRANQEMLEISNVDMLCQIPLMILTRGWQRDYIGPPAMLVRPTRPRPPVSVGIPRNAHRFPVNRSFCARRYM